MSHRGCGCCGEDACCSICDFSGVSITNLIFDADAEVFTQVGASTFLSTSPCEWRVDVESNVDPDPVGYTYYAIIRYQGRGGWSAIVYRSDFPSIALYESAGEDGWQCETGPTNLSLSVIGGLNPDTVTFTISSAGSYCACCVGCLYQDDAISNLSVTWGGGAETFVQNLPSYYSGLDPCIWFVPGLRNGITGSVPQIRKFGLPSNSIYQLIMPPPDNFTYDSDPVVDSCDGNVTFSGTLTGSFDIVSQGPCSAVASFFSLNRDIATAPGCRCKDAAAIMRKYKPQDLRRRLGVLVKLLTTDNGPAPEEIERRLTAWIDSQT